MLTRKYESEHAKSKNTIRGGQTTARYLCVKKDPFSHVVTVIRPRVSFDGHGKKSRYLYVLINIFRIRVSFVYNCTCPMFGGGW